MTDWISKKKKEQRRMGKPGGKKSPKIGRQGGKIKPEVVLLKLPDYGEKKKPHSTSEGKQASIGRYFVRSLGLKGGGIAQRGLGRAFNKGGKV